MGSNWDACPIGTLLEVVKSVVSCGTIVQVSFPHYCGQLNWCSVLNMEVMATFPKYFLSSLLTRLWCLPQCFVFWCKWSNEAILRCICSSSSSNDGFVHFPSSDLCPHVKSGLVWSSFLGLWSTCRARIGAWIGLCPSSDWAHGL